MIIVTFRNVSNKLFYSSWFQVHRESISSTDWASVANILQCIEPIKPPSPNHNSFNFVQKVTTWYVKVSFHARIEWQDFASSINNVCVCSYFSNLPRQLNSSMRLIYKHSVLLLKPQAWSINPSRKKLVHSLYISTDLQLGW